MNESMDSRTDNDLLDDHLRATALMEMALTLAARWKEMYATSPKE